MRSVALLGVLGLVAVLGGCGSSSINNNGDGDGGNPDDDGGGGPCTNLECFQVDCPAGGTTSLSGTVYAPNGTLPLYNVTVYVPNGTVQPFTDELTCDRCGGTLSGNPLVQTETDTQGRFVLTDVPATSNVPLVIQVGKWRRQVTIPNVPMCTDTPLTQADTRLARNKGEGDIPRIALSTGGADALECLLRKIGIDDAEIGREGGTERVHLYAGEGGTDAFDSGPNFSNAQQLWPDVASLARYDIVLLSCEGDQNEGTKPQSARQALHDYAGLGGRVFASHWHNVWIEQGADPWPQAATFNFLPDLNSITAFIDLTFDRGMSLADWLVNVGGSTTLGQIDLTATQHTVQAVNAAMSQRWIYLDVNDNGVPSVQYLSFTTPLEVPEDQRCGRVVFSDIHVSSGDSSSPGDPFPTGCTTTDLSPQEKVLAFMLFDIASCIGPGIP